MFYIYYVYCITVCISCFLVVFFKWTKRERKKKNPALLVASHRWNETKKILECVKEKFKQKIKLLLSYSDKFLLLDPKLMKQSVNVLKWSSTTVLLLLLLHIIILRSISECGLHGNLMIHMARQILNGKKNVKNLPLGPTPKNQ